VLGITNLARLAQPLDPPVVSGPVPEEPDRPLVAITQPASATPVAPALVAPTASTAASSPADTGPQWWLLYVLNGDLWVTGGEAPTQMTQAGTLGQPAWVEGALLYTQHSRNASDVWLASADGPPQPITHNTSTAAAQSHWATQPVLLPGGERAYVLGDFNKSATGAGNLAIWQLTLSSGAAVQVSYPPAYGGGDQDVTINPQNPKQIIFTRYSYDSNAQMVEQLQWFDLAEKTVVALTPPDQSARQANISPDGSQVAFVEHGDGTQQDLYIADLQLTGTKAELVNVRQVATGLIANPVWSPDGGSLAYIGLTNDQFQLWLIGIDHEADGTETFQPPKQLTKGPAIDATSRPVFLSADQADAVRQWLTQ
jgi:hypothetical protein